MRDKIIQFIEIYGLYIFAILLLSIMFLAKYLKQ